MIQFRYGIFFLIIQIINVNILKGGTIFWVKILIINNVISYFRAFMSKGLKYNLEIILFCKYYLLFKQNFNHMFKVYRYMKIHCAKIINMLFRINDYILSSSYGIELLVHIINYKLHVSYRGPMVAI